jgi:hypothetical protein
MGEHPSLLSGCTSTRVYVREAAEDWIFLRSYLGFSYTHTDSSWARGALAVLPQPQLQGASGMVMSARFDGLVAGCLT